MFAQMFCDEWKFLMTALVDVEGVLVVNEVTACGDVKICMMEKKGVCAV